MITTVNGSSTRSGFRDESGFSHQLHSPFGHLCPDGFLRDSTNWGEECVLRRGRGGDGGGGEGYEMKLSHTDSHTAIFENKILHYTPQI